MADGTDPYYRGADLANGYSPGGVQLDAKGRSARGKGFEEGYWRDGTQGGGALSAGYDGTPGGGGSPQGASASGVAGFYGDGDGRSADGGRSPGGAAGFAAGAGDDSATDAERLDKIDFRGKGGIKRYYGDDEDDGATPWATGDGITKKPKKNKKDGDDTPGTPMRSQKELYVDYDKLAEYEQ